MITFHHAWRKSLTAQDCTHWCLKNSLSCTCHVSFFAAPDTDHQHKFSLTCLTYLPVVLTLTPKSFGAPSRKKHPVDIPQNYVVAQQRQQMSELQFDRFPNPPSFLVWKKQDSKHKFQVVLISVGSYVADQRSGDGRFIG